jgi:hypothetical protein
LFPEFSNLREAIEVADLAADLLQIYQGTEIAEDTGAIATAGKHYSR